MLQNQNPIRLITVSRQKGNKFPPADTGETDKCSLETFASIMYQMVGFVWPSLCIIPMLVIGKQKPVNHDVFHQYNSLISFYTL